MAESNSIVQADYCIIKKTLHINLEEAELSEAESYALVLLGISGFAVVISLFGYCAYQRSQNYWKPLVQTQNT